MKCDDCRETFTLYYYSSVSDVASTTFPPWKETPYKKIDTVAAGSRFESANAGPQGINRKTLAIGPLDRYALLLFLYYFVLIFTFTQRYLFTEDLLNFKVLCLKKGCHFN